MKTLSKCVLIFVWLILPVSVLADEINLVEIDITVRKDRSAIVREYYKFVPLSSIRHGLYRNLPVKYFNSAGNKYSTPITIRRVEMDEKKSSYFTKYFLEIEGAMDNLLQKKQVDKRAIQNVVIYIGDENVLLTHEPHTTLLEYEIKNIIKEIDGQEVFGWNFQGYAWEIDKDSVVFHVHFPQGMTTDSVAYFVSNIREELSLDSSYYHYDAENNTYTVSYSDLYRANDITGYFYFPEGTFSDNENANALFWYTYKSEIILGITILFSALVWFLIWLRVGRDPKGLIRTTRVDSPNGFTPAECRYFRKEVVDKRSAVATVVHAAVNKFIEIEKPENDKYFTLRKTDQFNKAPQYERTIFKKLFSGANSFKVEKTVSVGARFKNFKSRIQKFIESKYPNEFKHNFGYFAIGLVPALAGLIWSIREQEQEFVFPLFFFLFIPYAIGYAFRRSIEPIMEGDADWKMYSLFGLSIVLAGLFVYYVPFLLYFPAYTLAMVILLHFSGGLWRYLMKNRTAFSKEMESKIYGFEHYLKQTEERYYDFLNDPEKAPVLFEKNLPYAIALECESRWAKAFEKAILEIPDLENYQPMWAHNMTYAYLATSMVDDMQSYSSYVAPSSSGSGWSGGGFSGGFSGGGGGFGGGGGGGW